MLDKLETQGQLEFEHKFETTETSVDTVCGEIVAPRFSSSNSYSMLSFSTSSVPVQLVIQTRV
jgi:hypothetical protein